MTLLICIIGNGWIFSLWLYSLNIGWRLLFLFYVWRLFLEAFVPVDLWFQDNPYLFQDKIILFICTIEQLSGCVVFSCKLENSCFIREFVVRGGLPLSSYILSPLLSWFSSFLLLVFRCMIPCHTHKSSAFRIRASGKVANLQLSNHSPLQIEIKHLVHKHFVL